MNNSIKINEIVLGNRLRVLRAEKNISQQQLAESIGLTRHSISRMEIGQHKPSIDIVLALAEYFETKVENIFFIKHGTSKFHE